MAVSLDNYYGAGIGYPSGQTMGGFSLPMAAPVSGGVQGAAVIPTSYVPKNVQWQTVIWAGAFLIGSLVLLHVLREA